MSPWLARVRHDLVKRLLWPARDRRDLGEGEGPLDAKLVDAEGRPTTAAALWAEISGAAPAGAPVAAFGKAVAAAEAAAARGDVDGVLALESAFAALARAVEGK